VSVDHRRLDVRVAQVLLNLPDDRVTRRTDDVSTRDVTESHRLALST
jgi:hypothetical protein